MTNPEWPTPDTAGIWRDFVESLERSEIEPWEAVPFTKQIRWRESRLAPGTPVRISDGVTVHTVSWEPVGDLDEPLDFDGEGALKAHVGPDSSSVDGEFLGRRRHHNDQPRERRT
jgi:hypothetical protein